MVTGFEATYYRDVARIASALERIADALELPPQKEAQQEGSAPDPAPDDSPAWTPPTDPRVRPGAMER